MKKIMAFLRDEEGASLIEYVLLAVVIGVGALLAMEAVRDASIAGLDEAAEGMGGTASAS